MTENPAQIPADADSRRGSGSLIPAHRAHRKRKETQLAGQAISCRILRNGLKSKSGVDIVEKSQLLGRVRGLRSTALLARLPCRQNGTLLSRSIRLELLTYRVPVLLYSFDNMRSSSTSPHPFNHRPTKASSVYFLPWGLT
jgi:hypothetical protein